MAIIIVPSIDLRGGQVVRLQQGDYQRQINYPLDPLATAKKFAAAGANWLHIVDLDGAKEGRPVQTELISQITAGSGMNVQVGGGVRATDDIARLRAAGAKRVVVGTRAMEDWTWFDRLVHAPEFAGRIVLALDAKGGHVATRGWTHASEKLAVAVAMQVSDWPLAAILYTDVAKDGMLQGPNFLQTRAIAEAGRVPVIASGGVGSIDHVRQLSQLPIWGAIVGR
ncbi:MAG TPA: 1-(5-phosphoribosyl)-5-[(5-phosphoribosylamino)methylideneamino] imidazole-4-carboxamide isomerase, partial [Tepidisphaeraceae bacterium]|nr:1-(5-phosphoribosyl)-5-[(5-phosphoribosylamino)methylideneamino] imidazole-4-carboxamide isomerase [Tepidisphaeraceae bacterium]